MKPVSESLNRQILKLAPRFTVSNEAPNSYSGLIRGAMKGIFLVYDGASSNTIYVDPHVNHAFRAWHDSLHLEHDLTFSLADELQMAELHRNAIEGSFEKALIYADVAEQVRFWYTNRKYVDNQRAFVLTKLEEAA